MTDLAEERERGRAVRKEVPRSSHGRWIPAADRPDPLAVLADQARTREPDLVPVRYGRMAVSPFTYLRGAPAVMAADLAVQRNTGLRVQLCGDAHLLNFGVFASPERTLLFDLNDFDETLPGPFEWDVKRLVASVAVAARDNGLPDARARLAARAAAESYRLSVRRLAGLGELDVWYERIAAADLVPLVRDLERARVEAQLAKARRRTSLQALERLTEVVGGRRRIVQDPPLLEAVAGLDAASVRKILSDYRSTLPEDRRVLLDRYRFVEAARKVVGVGSVGTRCFVALMTGRDTQDPLFLQIKEAQRSVLEPYLAKSAYRHQGQRVVAGQRLLQAASDIFLGWVSGPGGRHFYWRQLRDMKGSADVASMSPTLLRDYAALCGRALARAHARSGERIAIAAYLGASDTFDRAMGDFALAYAERTVEDHRTLLAAIESGAIEATPGV
ncbi:DUF2252 domain-containing protein [Streptomyces wuyuanensis]|uniref:Uncharacterized conserved protein, DUF2252 family n=1 Tax=Streptomyces wuyuanensis TaxID=1196353 RepID=A0A1G9PX35_9ACTN|nr:DUF2252 domain-containing protein [Streptomyces wuyuanensis]SDM02665.1 Uncharacterized conserved protein, DUF2252 family [Streptomyces wuyuanensis]